jgi:hypothetical protein
VGIQDEEVLEGTLLNRTTQVDSPEIKSTRISPHSFDFEDSPLSETTETITSKLKTICPTLFQSLTVWERTFFDESSFLDLRKGQSASPAFPCTVVKSVEVEVNNPIVNSTYGSVGIGLFWEDPFNISLDCNYPLVGSQSGYLHVRSDCEPMTPSGRESNRPSFDTKDHLLSGC